MNLARVHRSTTFRIASVFVGLFMIASVTLFAISFLLVSKELTKRLKFRITEQAQTFTKLESSMGFESVRESVLAHIATQRRDDVLFLLTDKDGNPVAGNIAQVPMFAGWKYFTTDDLQYTNSRSLDDDLILGQFFVLAGGKLLVGHSTTDIVEAQEVLVGSFAVGTAGSLALATLIALWFARHAQRRITSISDALRAVSQGDIRRRIAVMGSGDDLDQVSLRVNAALDQLQKLLESIRHLSTDIAHDLKTPIGRIQQRLDDALRSTRGSKSLRAALKDTATELDSVIETFDALLRIAQIEAGARKARFRAVDLQDVMNNVAEIYMSVAEDAGMRLKASLGNTAPAVIKGDAELLTQLIVNLVENAIRHCPPGSDISISIEQPATGPIITVSDTGPGIPETERSKVFQRLYRLEKSRTTPGSGLGLSLAAAIAELHGAKIELGDNDPGLIVKLSFPNQVAA